MIRFMRSTCSFLRGIPVAINTCFIFLSVQYFRNKLEVKAALQSDTERICCGFSNTTSCLDNLFIFSSANVDFVGYNHVNFVKASTITKR